MQVIPENLNITTGYHVFETPDDIIINSQIYDKITMEPKPYNFFNTNYCLNNKNLLLHEVNILEYPWAMIAKEPDYRCYIQDTQNSDIFYCVTEQAASNQNQYILKLQRLETGWKVLNAIAPDSEYRHGVNGYYGSSYSTVLHYKLLGQTDDYLILIQTMSGMSNKYNTNQPRPQTMSYVVVNKSNMSAKYMNVGVYYDYSVYLIKETNDSLYLLENLAGRLYIVRYDPYTNTRTVFHSVVSENMIDANCVGISNIIEFKNKYYVLTTNADNKYYAFREFTIDFEYNKVISKEITLPTITELSFHRATNRNDFLDNGWLQIDLKNIDDTYISITIHDNANKLHSYGYCRDSDYYGCNGWLQHTQTVLSNAKYHRHALYKYDETEKKFISKGIITPDESKQHIYGVLYYDQYTPIFFLNTRIMAYRLNLETEKYEKCFEKAGTYYTIGLDENNKFYMFDSNNNCSIYNDVTSYELFAKFEHDSYNYTNGPIDTYVTISSKNFLSEYINTKVELTLSGNCKFFENNRKTLITYTSSTGELNIPVTVTNGGTMYCYIKEVE